MEHRKTMLDIAKVEAEIAKLIAETTKINREARWYPVVVATAMLAAGATLAKMFF